METPHWKQRCLWLAECADAWRIVPRLLLLASCWFVYDITHHVLQWYMHLPAAERGIENGGFAASVFTVVTGLVTMFMNSYLKSGRKWTDQGNTE